MFKVVEYFICDKELYKCGIEVFGECVIYVMLVVVVEKYYCLVEFECMLKLFKLVWFDGCVFSKLYIDVSEDGVKVIWFIDLLLGEWEIEIVNCIKCLEFI